MYTYKHERIQFLPIVHDRRHAMGARTAPPFHRAMQIDRYRHEEQLAAQFLAISMVISIVTKWLSSNIS